VVDVPYIVAKRAKDPAAGALLPPALRDVESARRWIAEALAAPQHAQLYKDTRAWNVIHVQADGNARCVSVDAAADAQGRHYVRTAFLAKRGKYLRALTRTVMEKGHDALRFGGDDPARLWSTSHHLSEGNAGSRDLLVDSVAFELRQSAEAMERAKDPPPGKVLLDDAETASLLGTLAEVCKR
jgi:hypothetical protein